MRELEHRSHRSRHTSRSKSRERDRDRDYYSRKRRSKSRGRTSKSKKKKSKKKRYRRTSSSSNTSSRSRGSVKSSGSSIRRTTYLHGSEEHLSSVQTAKKINLFTDVLNKNTIDKIKEDAFMAESFFSTSEGNKIPEKVVIDLNTDTILVDRKVDDVDTEQQLFHKNFIGNDTRKMEKWIKKLYNYRQKMFQG